MAMFFDHDVFSCPLSLLGWAFTCLVGHPHGHLRTLTVAIVHIYVHVMPVHNANVIMFFLKLAPAFSPMRCATFLS